MNARRLPIASIVVLPVLALTPLASRAQRPDGGRGIPLPLEGGYASK
jgi:hypothetical protein